MGTASSDFELRARRPASLLLLPRPGMALKLPAHQLSDAPQSDIVGITFNASSSLFATSTSEGWVIYRTEPLAVISRRGEQLPSLARSTYSRSGTAEFPNSSLRFVLPLAQTNLLFLVGGPPCPLYPPNKVLFWDDKLGKTVAELEFREDVRGLVARRDRLVVVLRRRVIVFVLGKGGMGVWREGVYQTTDNLNGMWFQLVLRGGWGADRVPQGSSRSPRTRAPVSSPSQDDNQARSSSYGSHPSIPILPLSLLHLPTIRPPPPIPPSPSSSPTPPLSLLSPPLLRARSSPPPRQREPSCESGIPRRAHLSRSCDEGRIRQRSLGLRSGGTAEQCA